MMTAKSGERQGIDGGRDGQNCGLRSQTQTSRAQELRLPMNKRPLSITALGWLFIVVGACSLISHLSKSTGQRTFGSELMWICLIQLLAVLGGAFTLRGLNWARWLLVAWMAFHLVVSAFHSWRELLTHILLFGVIGYFLFRPAASAYFRRGKAQSA